MDHCIQLSGLWYNSICLLHHHWMTLCQHEKVNLLIIYHFSLQFISYQNKVSSQSPTRHVCYLIRHKKINHLFYSFFLKFVKTQQLWIYIRYQVLTFSTPNTSVYNFLQVTIVPHIRSYHKIEWLIDFKIYYYWRRLQIYLMNKSI